MTLWVLLLAVSPLAAQDPEVDQPISGHVIALKDDRIDIDAGGDILRGGDVGVIERDGAQIGLASVLWVDIGHTRLRVISKVPGAEPAVGDLVVFDARANRQNIEQGQAPHAGPAAVSKEEQDFVPLLAPVMKKKPAVTRNDNVFHGRVRLSGVYQEVEPNESWYRSERVDSDGSLERILGKPLSIQWSGNASRRDGSSFSTADDYRKVRGHLFRGTITLNTPGGGFARAGRFYPTELSGLGYVDGGQVDVPVAGRLRLGAAGGDRPDRVDMGFSGRENVAAAYASLDAGEARKLFFSESAGVMRTWYRGAGDELAALWDQRADLGPKLNLLSTLQADFDTGSALVHRGTNLTRFNASLNSPLTDAFSLHGGANRYRPLDTAAERDLAGGTTLYLNNGYWRYWGGASQSLTPAWQLDEDVSFTDTEGSWTPGQWRVALTRRGLPRLPSAYANVSGYSLYNPAGPDYGGTASFGAPLLDDKLNVDASAGARWGPTASSPRRHFWISDLSAHVTWLPTRAWSFNLGVMQSFQETLRSTVVNAGAGWRW